MVRPSFATTVALLALLVLSIVAFNDAAAAPPDPAQIITPVLNGPIRNFNYPHPHIPHRPPHARPLPRRHEHNG